MQIGVKSTEIGVRDPAAADGVLDSSATPQQAEEWVASGQALGQLVPLSSSIHMPYTCGLSTSLSTRALTWLPSGRPNLGVGFALRCFQRLSEPDMATRHCHWRDNRYTSGPFNPVLSY